MGKFWDWFRGYKDGDLESAMAKIRKERDKPGAVIPLTSGEWKAYMQWCRDTYGD